MIFLRLRYHFGCHSWPVFAVHGCPRWKRMAAAHELLILLLVAAAAVRRRHVAGDFEIVVRDFFLIGRRPMAFQAIHSLLRMLAQLVFMHDRILLLHVAFGTLAAG